MGPKLHFLFAVIFFVIGRKNGDNIFYFFAAYCLVIGISALVYRLYNAEEKSLPPETPE